MTPILVAAVLFQSASTVALVRMIVAERARSDRFASAVLHTAGEGSAARVIAPPTAKKDKEHPLHRPQQIGMTGR